MGPFFLNSDSLYVKLLFQANMSKPAMFSERSCKHARMFAMVLRTKPESEDFAYWDDDGMKVLHCDHIFELRSQESSLLLHQDVMLPCMKATVGISPVSCITSCP